MHETEAFQVFRLKSRAITQGNRFGSTPPRADLILVEHTDDSRFSIN